MIGNYINDEVINGKKNSSKVKMVINIYEKLLYGVYFL